MNSTTRAEGSDLVISRPFAARPEPIWRALTEPRRLKEWFVPRPWRLVSADMDPQPGGGFLTQMIGPEGETEDASEGCILVAEPPRRLIWTDALSGGWRPNESPFMTAIVTLQPEGEATLLTRRVLHRNETERQRHEDMGFAQGWGTILEQLAGLVE